MIRITILNLTCLRELIYIITSLADGPPFLFLGTEHRDLQTSSWISSYITVRTPNLTTLLVYSTSQLTLKASEVNNRWNCTSLHHTTLRLPQRQICLFTFYSTVVLVNIPLKLISASCIILLWLHKAYFRQLDYRKCNAKR
jgi:hypothetical protein